MYVLLTLGDSVIGGMIKCLQETETDLPLGNFGNDKTSQDIQECIQAMLVERLCPGQVRPLGLYISQTLDQETACNSNRG